MPIELLWYAGTEMMKVRWLESWFQFYGTIILKNTGHFIFNFYQFVEMCGRGFGPCQGSQVSLQWRIQKGESVRSLSVAIPVLN